MIQHSTYIVFDGDDEAYFNWMEQHPEGFVLNVFRSSIVGPHVVHRSNCGHIRRGPGMDAGAFTTRTQYKVAAFTVDQLETWRNYYQPDAAIKYCQTCNPA
ncbi:hypothetical protein [Herpetosiphon sp. NSE202]|uniref:hypothetical protein n=1 Tax=Herpetosiphon sp. NSE202 TaxID=3351349 RepID=UPI003629C311